MPKSQLRRRRPNPPRDEPAASAAGQPRIAGGARRRRHARDLPARPGERPQVPRPRRRRLHELAKHPLRRRLHPPIPRVPQGAAHARLPPQQAPRDVVWKREKQTLRVRGAPGLQLRLHRLLPPPACHERRDWHAIDSRHGLVLFHTPKRDEDFVICDLVTYNRWRIKANDECSDIIWYDRDDEGIPWNAAVLCAKDRCDHVYCHGGPFLVALVGSDEEQGITFASIYSSETHKWSDMISIEEPNAIEKAGHIAVVGDNLVIGFVEDVRVIFLRTKAGLYTIELSSGRSKKVYIETYVEKVMPYMSFYTRAWGRLPTSE